MIQSSRYVNIFTPLFLRKAATVFTTRVNTLGAVERPKGRHLNE
jgi:hypothetical protein